LNPATGGVSGGSAGGWGNSAISWAYDNSDPATTGPGSLGTALMYPSWDGPLKGTATAFTEFDSKMIMAEVDRKKAENTAFDTAKTTFETEKKAYEDAGEKEKTRRADIFMGWMQAAETIPARPELPARPPAYAGPTLAGLADAVAGTAITFAATPTHATAAS